MTDALDLLFILPEIVLALVGLVILAVDLFYLRRRADARGRSTFLGYFALIALVVVSLSSYLFGPNSLLQGLWPRLFADMLGRQAAFGSMFLMDGIAQVFRVVFLLVAGLVLLLSLEREWGRHEGEYYALLVFAVLGMILMTSAGELITLYVALELTSICLYVLTAMDFRRRSVEAGLKYFLFGAFSSAIMLYGLSLVYGFAGTTTLAGVAGVLGRYDPAELLSSEGRGLLLGVVFLVAGFGFKLALVPFHAWAPDAYEGAPTPITAFISTGSKAASFIVVVRVFQQFLPQAAGSAGWLQWQGWAALLGFLAVLTFTAANLMALPQQNLKRLLAYSSIAHAGYMLIGLVLNSAEGSYALFYYLMAYVVTNLGAFAAVIAVIRAVGGEEIKDFAGLSKRSLPLAGALTVLFLSLGGLPPLAGFYAKFSLFYAAFAQEGTRWLAIAGLINTVIAFYYYLRVLKAVWFDPPPAETAVVAGESVLVALWVTTVLVLLLGLVPFVLDPLLRGAVGTLALGGG